MVALRTAPGLVTSLGDLAHALESLDLEAASVVAPDVRSLRDHLSRTITSYLVPRLEDPKTPLCVVLAGPTGSGKSTLVNSLSGMDLSETGPLRPTTRGPVVLASSGGGTRYSTMGGVECEVVESDSLDLARMILVDSPDFDSTSVEHREMAERLIDSADVVVLVTSVLRYADEVPWEMVRRAQSRGTVVFHVLNRVTPDAMGALGDLRARLSEAGFDGDVFRVPEYHLTPGQHSLPPSSVKRLASRLREMARGRNAHQRDITGQALDVIVAGSIQLADALDKAKSWVGELQAELRQEFADAVDRLDLTGLADTRGFGAVPSRRRRLRRWLRRNQIDEAATARKLSEVSRRVTAAIEDDLGALALRPGDVLVRLSAIADPVESDSLRKDIQGTLEGWFDYVARVVEGEDQSRQGLATIVLVECALDDCETEIAAALFGDSAESVVSRARRELTNRLEALYETCARRSLSQIESPRGGRSLRGMAGRLAKLRDANA